MYIWGDVCLSLHFHHCMQLSFFFSLSFLPLYFFSFMPPLLMESDSNCGCLRSFLQSLFPITLLTLRRLIQGHWPANMTLHLVLVNHHRHTGLRSALWFEPNPAPCGPSGSNSQTRVSSSTYSLTFCHVESDQERAWWNKLLWLDCDQKRQLPNLGVSTAEMYNMTCKLHSFRFVCWVTDWPKQSSLIWLV